MTAATGSSRRLAGYRNPGPSQQTNLRVNAPLRQQLSISGTLLLAVAFEASFTFDGSGGQQSLDMRRRSGRLLAENVALVSAQITDEADIENLG
jgi:hypothetical protein